MFRDELTITASAGKGGNGVVRWRREKYRPKAGPAGGNGGRGGSVYVQAVPDVNKLAQYVGDTHFVADDGGAGQNQSMHGRNADDLYISVPVGSRVTDVDRDRTVMLEQVGESVKILRGGPGGLGNEQFKSSTNVAPEESTDGTAGESGTFLIEVLLVVDIGLIGLPNAGKSTLLNELTNARSAIGAYPFTTTEPHLGALHTLIIADIPGLIEGASSGKGLGHRFLRHVSRTKMLLHLVSLEEADPLAAYHTVRNELALYDSALAEKEEWIILTKSDTVSQSRVDEIMNGFNDSHQCVFVVSQYDDASIEAVSKAIQAYKKDSTL
jgi:GTP-binding protein